MDVAFFYNSVKEISNIVNQMPDTSDVEVLCAKTELHEATVPCYSKVFNPEKQIHFMTSAYFTGMDIDEKIRFWKVVFIGGNNASYLAYSNKTIKQGLGRFRGGYGSTAFITDGKVKDKFGYAHMKSMITKLDKKIQQRKKYAGDAEYVKDHIDEIVQENLDFLYYTSTVESMDGWDDFESFEKMMSEYPEYLLAKSPMPKPKRYPRARDISFKEYKQNRLKGIKVEYKYAAICEKFIEKYGLVEETVILTSMKHSIEYIRSNYPQLTCQWLRHQVKEEDYAWCEEWDVTLSVAHTSVTEDVVLRSQQISKDVATWTVNHIEDYQRVKDLGCKYVTTDYLVINQ